MPRRAFTMIEMLIVTLVTAIVMAVILKLLSGAFTGAAKGYDNLSILQEKSRLIAVLKQDLRTLIFAGADNIPLPAIAYDGNAQTSQFEFHKVCGIDENGRPLVEKITYQTFPENTSAGSAFGISRKCEVGDVLQRNYLQKMLTSFRMDLLDSTGAPIGNAADAKNLKKVRLVMESKGSELLATTVSVYSPYIPASGTASAGDLWCPNYMFAEYAPGAPIKLFQGGMIQVSGNTALGTPLSLAGATTLGAP
ncbi:MAG: hypothetical protein A2W80_00665 [Candidatus Riflebacteria bacterium GWC2_50_8]|nr:MAG: hypothetical protein A2W80_00665 [Candidatus Riflebacteria bacterium GWC2_50_8]